MAVTDEGLSDDEADVSPPTRQRGAAPPVRRRPRSPRRRISERLTASMVVGVVLALLAFVLVAAVLRDRREMTTALVPTQRIPAGVAITPEMVRVVEVPASVSFAGSLVSESDLAGGGLVAGRTLEAGEPLTDSAVGAGEARTLGRVMSIPLDSWGDVGGELQVGDQVDVIDTREAPLYVVQGAAVIDRAAGDGDGGGLSAGTRLWVSIEVSGEQALALAGVIAADEFIVVRSTGAEPVPTTPVATTLPAAGG